MGDIARCSGTVSGLVNVGFRVAHAAKEQLPHFPLGTVLFPGMHWRFTSLNCATRD